MSKTNHLQYLSTYSAKSTTSTAKYSIKQFLQSIYGDGNLDELVNRYFNETRDPEKDIETFFITLKSRPPTSIRTILSAVKIFLLENDIELTQRFWKRLHRRIRGNGARTQDRIPSPEELKQILLQMPQRGQALFLVLVSSGARIGEILQCELSDLNLETEPAQIHLRAEYTKNGNPRLCFISEEAKQFLLEYFKTREQYIESTAERCSQYDLDAKRKLVFPFSQVNAHHIWTLALKKAQLNMKDSSTGRRKIHPHCLRKYFRTNMAQKIPLDTVECLMGHSGYLTDSYRKPSIEQLAKSYIEGESAVKIFTDKHEIDKLKSTLGEQNTQFQKMVNSLTGENIKLKEEQAQNQERINTLETNFHYLTKHIEEVSTELYSKMDALQKLEWASSKDLLELSILREQKAKESKKSFQF